MEIKVIITVHDMGQIGTQEIAANISSKTKFSNLFSYLEKMLNLDKDIINTCTRFVHINLCNKSVKPIETFRVNDFIRLNDVKENNLIICFEYGGIGGGDYLNDVLRIEIRPNEGRHLGKPHIHVSNNKGRKFVTISLIDFKILSGKRYWKKFKRRERNDIIQVLKENKEAFTNYYNEVTKGYYPTPVIFIYKGIEHRIG